jgi:hypothetical protein
MTYASFNTKEDLDEYVMTQWHAPSRDDGTIGLIGVIVDPNAPVTTNEHGGSQSDVPVRFDLIDAKALFEMAKVLDHGAKKYGANNWRLIPVEDHLNHLLMHAYAYLAGDRTDDHLSHALCRATFALGVNLQPRCDAHVGNPIVTCELPLGHKEDHIFPPIDGDY